MGRARRLAGWFRRPARMLISAVLAVLVAVLLIFRDAVLGQLFPSAQIGDTVRQAQGDPVIEIVRVDPNTEEGASFARADDYRFSPADERTIADLYNPAGAALLAKARANGLPVGNATWRIYLRGNRNETARILNIRAVNIHREKPLSGTLFSVPAQGEDTSERMEMNLDSPDPVPLDWTTATPAQPPYFQDRTLSLRDQEDVIIDFRALTSHYAVSFDLVLDYQVGNQSGTETITDNGKPFALTAYNSLPNGLLDYRNFYSLSSCAPYGTYGICHRYPGR